MKKLYVGNLPYQTTEAELRTMFAQAGNVTSVAIITDRDTGRSRGFGFVEFESADEAAEAIRLFNDKPMGNRNLRVNIAQDRTEGRRGGSRRY